MTVTVLRVGVLLPSLAQPSQDRGQGSSMECPGHTDRLSTHPASAWAGPSVAWRGCPHGWRPAGFRLSIHPGRGGPASESTMESALPSSDSQRGLRAKVYWALRGKSLASGPHRGPPRAPPLQLLSMSGPMGRPGSVGILTIVMGHHKGGVAGARPLWNSPILGSPTQGSF